MGNQCCAFKGNKKTLEEAYSRTSIEHMSIEKIAEDRVKRTTSSSTSEKERRRKRDGETVKSEDKLSNEENSKEGLEKVTNDEKEEKSKEDTDRATGGRDANTVEATVGDSILYETPKRASTPRLAVEVVEAKNGDVETARSYEENGGTPILMDKIQHEITPIVNDEFGVEEEDDVVGEIPSASYDMRPIRPLPTPLRKVDITPNRRIEMFCDERGRVRRNEKIMRYMDDKRKSYENNVN